jgi:hypothetical protein
VNFDYLTAKYDPSGNLLWTARYDNGAGDFGHALGVDNAGNVYVTGRSHTSSADRTFDVVTVKYDPSGNQQWVNRYGVTGRDDMGLALMLDSSGNSVITGFGSNGTNMDMLTLKYDGNGSLLWARTYNNGQDDSARDLTVDVSGNVYITGWSNNAANSLRDYAAIKYDSAGGQLWVSRYNGSADSQDIAQSVVIDGNGNVVITGWSYNGVDFDYTTVKYNASGIEQWAVRYDNGAGDFGHVVKVDGSGNVYVTGRSHTSLANRTFDVATVKYDSNGIQQWARRYDQSGLDDMGLALVLGSGGNVYATGFSNNGVTDDIVTLKLDANGNLIWVARYNNGRAESARSITLDGLGNILITGWSHDSSGVRDYVTVKYSP